MIPILFEKNETSFYGNGLCRLHDCISCLATEERNSIYECDFEYPITGRNFQEIKIGRIIGVTHEESDDIQPFDIVSFSRPINGTVTFHCTHISYRLSYVTAVLTNINSLSEAFTQLLWRAQPYSPFYFDTNRDIAGYLSVADGIPHSVRQILGGVEGSILDTYGGEYEWNKFSVFLHTERGTERDITIRYGLNMLDYNEDYDIQGSYSSCVPYWTNGTETVVGDKVDAISLTITGREECVPLDLSDKFENAPTKLDLNRLAASYMNKNATFKPAQNIHIEFVRLNDLGYEEFDNLLECNLCDTITVVFPDYNGSAQYKIVKTTWDVLRDRYESMELGELSTTLAQALGVSQGTEKPSGAADFVTEQGTSGIWTYRKWNSGIAECWGSVYEVKDCTSAWGNVYDSGAATSQNFPSGLFASAPTLNISAVGHSTATLQLETSGATLTTRTCSYYYTMPYSATGIQATVCFHAVGRWR